MPAAAGRVAAAPMPTMPATAAPIVTDALVIGAGPVGLFQVFELGLLEVSAHVVDALPEPGGQCAELYPDKPIYDIPAVPLCTGRELAARLQQQIAPFNTPFHLGQEVSVVQSVPSDDGRPRFAVQTGAGTRFDCRAIVIAGGAGAFRPRTLKLDGLDRLAGSQVFHRLDDPAAFAGRRVVVAGNGDSAIEWALSLAAEGPQQAASVSLLHRRDDFQAAPDAVERLAQARAAGRVHFVAGQATGLGCEVDGRMTHLQLLAADGTTTALPLDRLLVALGLSPRLGPIADWGLAMERKQLVVDTAAFQTSVPGIYAVGDVNTYPGKRKLIVSGFHEATLAAFAIAAQLRGEPVPLQYTTTSPRLHRLLGVAPPTQG
jgi:thioredoxin reductase (NADPH)